MAKEFGKLLQDRKIQIVKTFIDIYIFVGTLVSVLMGLSAVINFEEFITGPRIFYFVLVLISTITLIFFKYKVVDKNYRIPFFSLVYFTTIISIPIMLLEGTSGISPAIFISVLVFGVAIVEPNRYAKIYLSFLSAVYIILFIIHSQDLIEYTPETTESTFNNTFLIIVVFILSWRISKIGFGEIEHSYDKALEYSKELEELNRELDQRVKDRTERLRETFEQQAENLYKTAVIGSITRPLLHDLATPLSALQGSLELIKNDKKYDQELVEIVDEAGKQIHHILNDSRNLIRGNDVPSVIHLSSVFDRLGKILRNELQKYGISLIVISQDDYDVFGVQSTLERIFVNIVMNAVVEILRAHDGEKVIGITVGKESEKMGFVKIADTGSGIPKQSIEHIFEEDFSLKETSTNLGLGLPFVN